jgi:hypothetical protein
VIGEAESIKLDRVGPTVGVLELHLAAGEAHELSVEVMLAGAIRPDAPFGHDRRQ